MQLRSTRRGVSLLEILFSMLLVSVGLFGTIALLPVAAHQAKRGRIADAQAVAGESAVSAFFVRDLGNAPAWISPSDPAYFKSIVDVINPMTGMPFVNPMTGMNQQRLINYFPVVGYCLDPMFVSVNGNTNDMTNNAYARYFPYYVPDNFLSTVGANSDPTYSVRMERITLARSPFEAYQLGTNNTPGRDMVDDDNDQVVDNASETGWPGSDDFRIQMTLPHALSIFFSDDDQLFDRVTDSTIPATQLYSRLDDGMGNVTNLRRLAENNLSWFATLAPRASLIADAATQNDYVLSVVVMYKRSTTSVGLAMSAASTDTEPCHERLLEVASFPGAGVGGGSVVLQARPNRLNGDLDCRPGDWVMLSGSFDSPFSYGNWVNPQPAPPVPVNKRPFYQWYRVLDSDPEIIAPSGVSQRMVNLAGPDWPLVHNPYAMTPEKSRTQATLVTGVVGVYEKTVRLKLK